jgi:hypothetical protein
MSIVLLAMFEAEGAVVMWWGFGMLTVMLLWMFYMMTFRTDQWLRMVKAEEERKEKRRQQRGRILKGGFFVFKIMWMICGKR